MTPMKAFTSVALASAFALSLTGAAFAQESGTPTPAPEKPMATGGTMTNAPAKGGAMKSGAMKGGAMKGGAMKGGAMKGSSMKGGSMKKKK